MSFRRIPFQFSSTDPVERQAELEKRFGLPPKSDNMYVDVTHPLSMSAARTESSNSPRLQHRVPIFMEGYDQPIKASVDSVSPSSDVKKKPNVRVIPIEIEGDYQPTRRHRTFSGPAEVPAKETMPVQEVTSPLKRSIQNLSQPPKVSLAVEPKVHNIPIKIENRSAPVKKSKPNVKSDHSKVNGCVPSKEIKPSEKNKEPEAEPKVENVIETSLKKIEDVLKELESYDKGVNEFTGTMKDKQYRYLDEMLTRCMLRLDVIETMGNEELRLSRKNAVKKVQACIDLLESKVNTEKCDENAESQPVGEEMKVEETEVAKEFEVNRENAVKNLEEVKDCQTDVDMKEGQTENHEAVDAGTSSEVKTSGSVLNEVEMSEDQTENCKTTSSEVKTSDESSVVNEVEMSDNQIHEVLKDSAEIKAPEIEMAEDSNTESADEIPEVEMAEGTEVSKIPACEQKNSDISRCTESETDMVQETNMDVLNVSQDCAVKQFDCSNSTVDQVSSEGNNSIVLNCDSKENSVTDINDELSANCKENISENEITTEL